MSEISGNSRGNLVAIVPDQAQKVAIWWQKSWENPGRSGKKLMNSVPKCGKTGKYKEETSDSSGIT